MYEGGFLEMKTVTVGMIGSGFVSNHHCRSYHQVAGVQVRLKTVSDILTERAKTISEKYGFESYTDDYTKIIKDQQIDVVDICTPPFLHKRMVEEALLAGKHVICEKPLTGYFGHPGDPTPIGEKVPKSKMYAEVIKELEGYSRIAASSNRYFMYAENYIYTPNIQKAAEIIRAKKSRILFMRGDILLRGSSSPVAGLWDKTGGGCLIRNGTHPLSGLLWLKSVEAEARGVTIDPISVVADTTQATTNLTEEEHRHILIRPVDVEDIATVSITFSDHSQAVIIAGDVCLGGVKNEVDIYANDVAMYCKIIPNDNMETYLLDEKGIENMYLAEMLPNKLGWQKPFISEEIQRGYAGEMQDFMECVAYGRKPVSNMNIAKETTKLLYASFLSAEEGRKVTLS